MDFLSGTRLLLRAIEPEDVSFVYRWENDPSAWGDGCALAPYSRYAIRTYIEESQRQDIFQSRQLRLMIVCQNDKSVAGMVDLFDFDPYHRRAAVGIYVDTRYRKQGMASEALELLCRYAFDFLHLHQLYAHVAERNAASLRLFESSGFERCGLLSQWICRDKGCRHLAAYRSDLRIFEIIDFLINNRYTVWQAGKYK